MRGCGLGLKVSILVQIFSELAKIGPVVEAEREEASSRSPWLNTDPHPGLRAYPFLSQVWTQLKPSLCACKLTVDASYPKHSRRGSKNTPAD